MIKEKSEKKEKAKMQGEKTLAVTRIGIIGLGGIATGKHISELVKIKEAPITAICDINEEKLKTVGDKLDIDSARRFVDYHDLIACADVDAVEICTPNYLHVPMAVEAVKAGITDGTNPCGLIPRYQAAIMALRASKK